VLLDSVIVIDYLNDIPEAVAFVDAHPDAAISVITIAEVLGRLRRPRIDRRLKGSPCNQPEIDTPIRSSWLNVNTA
jgi:hypothetical protein